MNKIYIDKEEWIGRLEEELSTCKNEKRKEYLRIWINAIKCQPTVDIKEDLISRSSFEKNILKVFENRLNEHEAHLMVEFLAHLDDEPSAYNEKIGEWIFKREGTYNSLRAYCSVCGKRSGIGGIKENQMKPYCPNCGAKMTITPA